jgi:hypothetical protein
MSLKQSSTLENAFSSGGAMGSGNNPNDFVASIKKKLTKENYNS